ncbi:MAG: DNA polymerase III subunit delta [Acidobacteria bacterium]|nr:DNA polymerase III subunit delta [Acidobacteriota bacterium]
MATITAAAVRKQIQSGTADPIYLLQGEDEVEKSGLAHEFEELVDEGLRAFNVERIHTGEITTGEKLAAAVSGLVTAVRTLPMMSPRRVVIVLQAQSLLVPKRESEAASRALEELEDLLKAPEPQTTLVLVAGTLDKRSRMYKLLAKQATLVECGVLESVDDAARWVVNRVAAAEMKIEPAGARLLAERCGTDVKRLRNDVDRLLLYALGQKSISLDDVREVVGPAALQDDWAMANAIEAGDGKTALRQLALMLDAGAAPEQIMGQLGWLVRTKFPMQVPAMLRPAVQALFRTDLDLKRSAGEPRVLLERLVVELCARGAGRPSQAGGARRY